MPKAPRAPHAQCTLPNANRWSTRTLVTLALLCAIGVLLSFLELPLLPGVTWLKYDASAVPALLAGFAFGPSGGIAVGVVGAAIHGILFADLSGAVMNMLCVVAFVGPAAALAGRCPSLGRQAAALADGVACMVAAAILGNLVITPAWLGVPLDAVIAMIVPVLLPFNLLKGILNAILATIAYRAVSGLLPSAADAKGASAGKDAPDADGGRSALPRS